MKFLITGATGLIGSSILKQAIKNNNKVNYLTTRRKNLILFQVQMILLKTGN